MTKRLHSKHGLSFGKCSQHSLRLMSARNYPRTKGSTQSCIYYKNLCVERVTIILEVILQDRTVNCTVKYTVC